jgi:hypothetical protein
MSWFKDAFERVKEKGAAVKGIAKEVSVKAKEVRSRLIGTATASELHNQLEGRAGSISSLLELVDVLRGWSGNILSDNPKYLDVDRQLTFFQVLLRSRTIEELLAFIVCHGELRAELCGVWPGVASMEETPGTQLSDAHLASLHLYSFLSKCLRGDKKIWHELVCLLLAPHGRDDKVDLGEAEVKPSSRPRAGSRANWLTLCEQQQFRIIDLSAVASLKRDWYDDFLEKERKEMALNLDKKRSGLLQAGDSVWQRVRISTELVELYESVRDNLDDCTMHRAGARKDVIASLTGLESLASQQITTSIAEKENTKQRQETIRGKIENMETEFKPRLEAILEERTAIDFKIANLEETKKRLKLELEKVSQELVEAQTAQKDVMEYEQEIRADLVESRKKFNDMLSKEFGEEKASEVDGGLAGRMVELIRKIGEGMESSYQSGTGALGDMHTQVESAFVEAIQEHMQILGEAIQDLYRKSKRLADELESVKRTRNAQSMSAMLGSGQNENETEEFSATLDRLELKANDLMDRLAGQSDELGSFADTLQSFLRRFDNKITGNRLLKGEVDKIQFVLAETEKILRKYSPSVPQAAELLVEESPESPRDQSS